MNNLPALYLAREALQLGSDRELRHSVMNGTVTRIGIGVFVDTAAWLSMQPDERYRTRVRGAAAVSAHGTQFSHDSAAALWRLPSIGPWPTVTHTLTAKQRGGSSRVQIRRHGLGLDPLATNIDGPAVTSLARTVIDMACTTPLVRAVAMADAALRTPQKDEWHRPSTSTAELASVLETLLPYRGHLRAQRVINLANGKSESPGESFARVQFLALGYPPPELQVEFFDELGYIGTVDFFWPHLGLICEFDGISKYGAERRYQLGLTPEQILINEKSREDRLRRVSNDFVRLGWSKVADRRALAGFLARHGLISRTT